MLLNQLGYVISLILSQRRSNCSTGWKKLKQVEAEIQPVMTVWHQNLINFFAGRLNILHSSGPLQLMVLLEQGPALALHVVVQDCDSLREERASDYLGEILSDFSTACCRPGPSRYRNLGFGFSACL